MRSCFALAVASATFTSLYGDVKAAQSTEASFTFLFPPTTSHAWQDYSENMGKTLSDAGLEGWHAFPINALVAHWPDVLVALENGMVELAVVPATTLAEQVSAFSVLDLPLAFTSIDEGRAFVAGDAGQILAAAAVEDGFTPLGYIWQLDVLLSMNECISRPAAMRGRRIRVSDPEYVELLQAAGAAINPLPGFEVLPAFERGLVDAGLFAAELALDAQLATVATCLISPQPKAFALTPYVFVARKNVLEALPAPVVRALHEAVATVEAAEDRRQGEVAAGLAEAFRRSDRRVEPLEDSAVAEWSALAADIHARFAASAEPGVQKLLELTQ